MALRRRLLAKTLALFFSGAQNDPRGEVLLGGKVAAAAPTSAMTDAPGPGTAVSADRNGARYERLGGGRDSAATADRRLGRECPFLTMVPVMAFSDLC